MQLGGRGLARLALPILLSLPQAAASKGDGATPGSHAPEGLLVIPRYVLGVPLPRQVLHSRR